jgi:hypothetical protein
MKKLFPLTLSLILVWNLNAQVTANFSFPGGTLCAGTGIDFTDLSSTSNSSIVSWEWTEDSPQMQTFPNQNPTFNWQEGGAFTVCLTATDDQGVQDDTCLVVMITDAPIADAGPDQVINCAVAAVTLDGSGSSSGANIQYVWTDGSGNNLGDTPNIQVFQSGLYILEVTDLTTGCVSMDTVLVSQDIELPIINLPTPEVLTCVVTEIEIGMTLPIGNFEYLWTTPDGNILTDPTQSVVVVNAVGTYLIEVTNLDNSCTSVDQVIVLEDLVQPFADAGSDTTFSCANPELTLNGGGSSLGPAISYFWNTPDGSIINNQFTINPIVDAPGAYILLVTDSQNGCFDQDTVLVFANGSGISSLETGEEVSFLCNQETLCEDSDEVTVLIAYEGSDSNALVVNKGAGTIGGDDPAQVEDGVIEVYGLTEGENWSVSVQSGSCTFTSEGVIPANVCGQVIDLPVFQETCILPLALDYSSQDPGSAYSYLWTAGPGGLILNADTSLMPEVDGIANYILTVTDDNDGCSYVDTLQLIGSGDDSLTVSVIEVVDILCTDQNTGFIDIEISCGQPPYSVAWNTGDTTQDLTVLSAGLYFVTVVDDLGNFAVPAPITVEELGNVAIQNLTASTLSCFGDSSLVDFSVSGTAPFSYLWSDGSTEAPPRLLPAGDYSVIVTDSSGCSSLPANFTINTPPFLFLSFVDVTCASPGMNDGSVELDVSGGVPPYLYDWNEDDFDGESNPVGMGQGNYSVTVTDANGCTREGSIALGGGMTVFDADICEGEVYIFDGIPYSETGFYEATFPSQFGCDSIVGLNLTVLPAVNTILDTLICAQFFFYNGQMYPSPGSYEVVLTAANGCDSIVNLNLFGGSVPLNLPETIEFCSDSAALDFTAYDPGPGHSYNWITSNGVIYSGDTTLIPVIGAPGFYELIVADTLTGCTGTDVVWALGDTSGQLTLSHIEIMNPSCNGGSDGSIELTVTCGTPPYSFAWDIGGQDSVLNNLIAGTYVVTITDSGMDTIVEPITLVDPTPLLINISASTPCPGDAVFLDLTVAGGACPPYSFMWSTNEINEDILVFSSGTYCVTVTDACGCALEECVIIDYPDLIEVSIDDVQCASFGNADGSIDISVSGGYPPYAFSWLSGGDPVSTSEDLINIPAGSYELTVIDSEGCSWSTVIDLNDGVITSLTPDQGIWCANSPFPLSATAPDAQVVSWIPETGLSCSDCLDPVLEPEMAPITYALAVENTEGCRDTAYFTLAALDDACVWPGDTDTNKVVNHFDLLNIGLGYDSLGPLRPNASLLWEAQPGPDWLQQTPGTGVNYKHIDTNGDGLVNADDTLAITQNWGATHGLWAPDEEDEWTSHQSDLLVNAPFYIEPDTLIPGQAIELEVVLGENGNPVEDLYGLAFSITYDTSVVEVGSADILFDPSWLGLDEVDLIGIHKDFYPEGRMDVAMTRIDGMEISGEGQLATLFIIVQDDVLLWEKENGTESGSVAEAAFSIENVRLINFQGQEIIVQPQTSILPLDTETSITEPGLEDQIRLFPNPANQFLTIDGPEVWSGQLMLYDAAGKIVLEENWKGGRQMLDVSGLSSGVYGLRLVCVNGTLTRAVVVSARP